MPIANIQIKNLDETMTLLKGYAPEQAKEINKRITAEAVKVRDRTRDYMPETTISNWGPWKSSKDGRDLGYYGSVAQAAVKTTRGRFRQRGVVFSNYIGIISGDPGGSIFQTVGNGSSKDVFVMNMLARFPKNRGLWRAFNELRPEVEPAVLAACQEAQDIVNARMKLLGGV